MTDNMVYTAIDTDRAISDILNNFSDDFIENIVSESLKYKFRPYNTRMPNHPYVLERQFQGIYDNYLGDKEIIDNKRRNTYLKILDILCEHYNLEVTTEVPEEQLYSFVYTMYQIFITEFTERMINFLSNYIFLNRDSILNNMSDTQKSVKTSYAKKLYSDSKDQGIITLYDNMDSVFDIVSSIDIPFITLIELLSDKASANFINNHITDCGDIYKNHYAVYLKNFATRTDMLTNIKLRLVSYTANNASILLPDKNPCIVNDEDIK